MAGPTDILYFWFEEAGPEKWYQKSDAFDAEIRRRFENIAIKNAASLTAPPHPWEAEIEGSLALIISLDQFSRNMYRDTAAAYAWDALALGVSQRLIENGWDLKIDQFRRIFAYLPIMHSENLDHQNLSVELCDQRIDNPNNYKHAVEHRKLIKRFGRFPYRNEVLGRKSTDEEIQFLKDGGYVP